MFLQTCRNRRPRTLIAGFTNTPPPPHSCVALKLVFDSVLVTLI
jgi:hypothetical protein